MEFNNPNFDPSGDFDEPAENVPRIDTTLPGDDTTFEATGETSFTIVPAGFSQSTQLVWNGVDDYFNALA